MKWNIIFFGENLPSGQVPQSLISGCHPGWMTGNSSEVNIYIRAQAVVAGCSGGAPPSSTVADARLAQVIVHEIGHGIEGAIGRGRLLGERYRAEGFATWFEQYVAEFSPLLRGENIPRTFKKLALQRLKYYPGSFTFQGSSYDYAYSSMYFVAISKRFGVRGLFAVYDEMIKNQVSFFNAIERRFNWSPSHLEKEVSRILN